MPRATIVQLALIAVGLLIWGYGYRADDSNIRLGGMAILVVVLLMRWIPKSWLGGDEPQR